MSSEDVDSVQCGISIEYIGFDESSSYDGWEKPSHAAHHVERSLEASTKPATHRP